MIKIAHIVIETNIFLFAALVARSFTNLFLSRSVIFRHQGVPGAYQSHVSGFPPT